MIDTFLDLERLRGSLRTKGLDEEIINTIIEKADYEIQQALADTLRDAMDLAVQSGVQKDSAKFINELRPVLNAFRLETESGNTDFSDPPYPMLDNLLKGAKPMKDGSGVYKIIPVGSSSGNKRTVHSNIFDAQKAMAAERYSAALVQYNKIKPKDSKVEFRTATSKQSRATQWVKPAVEMDFTDDLKEINTSLDNSVRDIIERVIRSYEEEL
jgi:hypothetical protein